MTDALGIINLGAFVAGVVVIILMPGPNSLYVLATATRHGVRDGYRAACGVFIGDGVLMLLASAGAESLARLYPQAFSAVQYAGSAYLAYLGFAMLCRLWSNKEASQTEADCRRERPLLRALALSLSNPKAILFFVSFFVQFVDPHKGHPALAFLVLACIVQAVSAMYLSVLIFSGARLSELVRQKPVLGRIGTGVAGTVFVGFGFRLAFAAAGNC